MSRPSHGCSEAPHEGAQNCFACLAEAAEALGNGFASILAGHGDCFDPCKLEDAVRAASYTIGIPDLAYPGSGLVAAECCDACSIPNLSQGHNLTQQETSHITFHLGLKKQMPGSLARAARL